MFNYKNGETITIFTCLFCGMVLSLSAKQDDYQCKCGRWAKFLLDYNQLWYGAKSKEYSQLLGKND